MSKDMIAFANEVGETCEMTVDNDMSLDFCPKQVEECYCDLLIWAKIRTSGVIRGTNVCFWTYYN